MKVRVISCSVASEADVVSARQTARFVAQFLGFDQQDQTRVAAAVSELARNAYQYAGAARFEIALDSEDGARERMLYLRMSDNGPGMADTQRTLRQTAHAESGQGRGLTAVRRLMDAFEIDSNATGTVVEIGKCPPDTAAPWDAALVLELSRRLSERAIDSPLETVRQQNEELLRALEALKGQQDETLQLNRELEETNAGVMALYAELDEKAESLRRSNESKGRFFSYMNHEVRTPINSILSLSEILQNGSIVAPLPEQKKALGFIRKAAEQLLELVNDLLDVAKMESGKMQVRCEVFSVTELFAALRGMFRPLHSNERVVLDFSATADLPTLQTDEGKVSQVLRNLISNALKFTEKGSVHVSAAVQGNQMVFAVTDTGIGIAREDQKLLFQDFAQIENPKQSKIKGTGLGLALSRHLAQLLGGELSLQSRPGEGSVFTLTIPQTLAQASETPLNTTRPRPASHVLLVARDLETLGRYQYLCENTPFKLFPATSLDVAHDMLVTTAPHAIVVDFDVDGPEHWRHLQRLCRSKGSLPLVLVADARHEVAALALGINVFVASGSERDRLLDVLEELTGLPHPPKLLIIDDDEAARYLLRCALGEVPFSIHEAQDGSDGLAQVRSTRPDAIFLDLNMPHTDGFAVLSHLKDDIGTRDIPIIIHTARPLTAQESAYLSSCTTAIVRKGLSHGETAAGVQAALHKAGLHTH